MNTPLASRSVPPAARSAWPMGIVGLLLAVGSYWLLHRFAEENSESPMVLGQYLLPAVFVVASGWMTLRRRRSTERGHPSLEKLSIDQINALLRETFQAQGYQALDSAAGARDRHADLVLRRNRETFLVWAKPWRERRVEIEPVQQLCKAMASRGAAGGFLISTGRFGREATAYAAGHNVRLIDGVALRGLIAAPRRGQPSQH